MSYLRALLYTPVYWYRSISFSVRAIGLLASQPKMFWVYCCLSIKYLFNNAYSVSRDFFVRCNDVDVQTIYGETPLVTFDKIARFASLNAQMRVYELGCGRGAGVFWWALRFGCESTGIDINDRFVEKAAGIGRQLSIANASFDCSNLLSASLDDADVIYLYGTAFSDDTINKIIAHFATLPVGTKVITVSYALTEYPSGAELFQFVKQTKAEYLWGMADLYLQVKR